MSFTYDDEKSDWENWNDYLEDKADDEGYDSVPDMIDDYMDYDRGDLDADYPN